MQLDPNDHDVYLKHLQAVIDLGRVIEQKTVELEAAVALAEKKQQEFADVLEEYEQLKEKLTSGVAGFYLDIAQRILALRQQCERDILKRDARILIIEGINETDEVNIRISDKKQYIDVVIVIKPNHKILADVILSFFKEWKQILPPSKGSLATFLYPPVRVLEELTGLKEALELE